MQLVFWYFWMRWEFWFLTNKSWSMSMVTQTFFTSTSIFFLDSRVPAILLHDFQKTFWCCMFVVFDQHEMCHKINATRRKNIDIGVTVITCIVTDMLMISLMSLTLIQYWHQTTTWDPCLRNHRGCSFNLLVNLVSLVLQDLKARIVRLKRCWMNSWLNVE